jgi:hypothetical protein
MDTFGKWTTIHPFSPLGEGQDEGLIFRASVLRSHVLLTITTKTLTLALSQRERE